MALCAGLISTAWMAREGGYFRPGRYSEFILVSRCDGFALGGLMALILDERRRVARHINRYRLAFGLVALLSFVNIAYQCYSVGIVGYLGLPTPADPAGTHLMVNLFYFGIVGTVVTLAGHRLLAPLRWRPLCDLGVISYGMYLYHYPIYWAVDDYQILDEHSLWKGAAKMALTLVVAIASWHLFERPLLSLKEWFQYDANDRGVPVHVSTPTEELIGDREDGRSHRGATKSGRSIATLSKAREGR
jgi:peptidoglycan/LPS O-acetylase OafA/YrhL